MTTGVCSAVGVAASWAKEIHTDVFRARGCDMMSQRSGVYSDWLLNPINGRTFWREAYFCCTCGGFINCIFPDYNMTLGGPPDYVFVECRKCLRKRTEERSAEQFWAAYWTRRATA